MTTMLTIAEMAVSPINQSHCRTQQLTISRYLRNDEPTAGQHCSITEHKKPTSHNDPSITNINIKV